MHVTDTPATTVHVPASVAKVERMTNDWKAGLLRRCGWYALITMVFTMVLVNYSIRYGRLAIGPTDDDCNYLVDALQRLSLLQHTPKSLVVNLLQHPPHSPFSTALGLFAFTLFGPHQWAPYVCNGVLVFGLLLAVDYLTRRASTEARFASILFALSFPFTANMVTEYRPDCAVGLVTGFGIVLLLRKSPLTASRNRCLAMGLLAATALLIKPSFAPFTVIAFATAYGVSALLVNVAQLGETNGPRLWLSRLGWFMLPVLVLAVPYYILSPNIVRYIQNQAFGKFHPHWAMKESSLSAVLRYYWDGTGGQMMLGRHRYIVIALGLAVAGLMRRNLVAAWRVIAGYLVIVAVTYFIPSLTRMANPFFGSIADVLLLFGAILLLLVLFREMDARISGSKLLRVSAWAAVALGVIAFRWPPVHYDRASAWAEAANRVGEQTYQIIRDQPGSRNARVFFTAPGPVDDMLFRFHAGLENRRFECPNKHLSNDINVYRAEIESADFVVASEPQTGLVYEHMIAPNIQSDALQIARDTPHLAELAVLPALNGKSFHIFVRRDLATTAADSPKAIPFENPWGPLYGGE